MVNSLENKVSDKTENEKLASTGQDLLFPDLWDPQDLQAP